MKTVWSVLLICLGVILASTTFAARGFDTTDGAASTDLVTTTTTSLSTSTSWCMYTYRTANSGSGNGRMFDKGSGFAGTRLLYEDTASNKYHLEVDWSITDGLWTTPRPSAGAWHQVCVTYDGSSIANTPVMYIDGSSVTVTTSQAPVGTLVTGSTAYIIGNRADGIRVWNGRLAEFAIWEGALLSAGNITTLYNSGLGLRADSPTLGIAPSFYMRLCGNNSPEQNEVAGASTGALTGTTKQTHPFAICAQGGLMSLGVGQ